MWLIAAVRSRGTPGRARACRSGVAACLTMAMVMVAVPLASGAAASPGFRHADRIDNPWMPLAPGTEMVLEGSVVDQSGRSTAHRIVTIVTNLTKVVNGVTTEVLWDRDYDGVQLSESELYFNGEDDAGNVWLEGEYPELYRNGRLQGAPATWIAGVEGATPGIVMPADPRPGTPSYSEGRALEVGFDDMAKVSQSGVAVCAPVGCYQNALVIDEWAPNDPRGGHQLKYYAAGVGNVKVAPVGGAQQEELALISVDRLSPADLASASAEALQIDRRAYGIAAPYSQTARARFRT